MVWRQGAERPGSWLAAAGGRAHRHQVLALQVEQEPRGIRSLQEGVQGAVAGGRGAWRQGAGAERPEGGFGGAGGPHLAPSDCRNLSHDACESRNAPASRAPKKATFASAAVKPPPAPSIVPVRRWAGSDKLVGGWRNGLTTCTRHAAGHAATAWVHHVVHRKRLISALTFPWGYIALLLSANWWRPAEDTAQRLLP